MADGAEPASLAEMTVEIDAAYVAHNQVAASDLPKVISTVAGRLRILGREFEAAVPDKPEPVVPVRRSVRPDHLVCLICGKKQKLLKRHLAVEHEVTPKQYRETFGLKPDYPMAAPSCALGFAHIFGPTRQGRRLIRRHTANWRSERTRFD